MAIKIKGSSTVTPIEIYERKLRELIARKRDDVSLSCPHRGWTKIDRLLF